MKKTFLILSVAALTLVSCSKKAETIALIPQPVSMTTGTETFTIPSNITIAFDSPSLEAAANFIGETLNERIGTEFTTTNNTENATITIELWQNAPKPEAYKLEIDDDKIEIEVADHSGAIYALQTILQLLPEEVFANSHQNYALPEVEITDYPRFKWRGMHLDCSRHFFTADEIKKYIDYIAMHKLNIFHWHFTDDQGWRMESKKYPLLTEKSAWRVDRTKENWSDTKPIDRSKGEEATYGGFYTQEQIKDIVAYAKERGVTVIPEVEMPGHTSEVFAAYPELSCLGKLQEVTPGGYYPADMATCFCAGNEDVFTFLENILVETSELFPDAPYIHIGGDEVDKKFWENCPKCKARMKKEGLKDTHELQSYFIKRIEKFVNEKIGKPIIGWDEILEGGLAPNATVMSWQGVRGGITAAKAGHDVVMTPNSHLYFDYYQNNPEEEPQAIGGYLTTKMVYSYEPIAESFTKEEAKHVLGAQANVWTEFIQDFSHVEYMSLPRMSALAEIVWSPKESKNWDNFSKRLATHNNRLGAMGANYHKGCTQIDFETTYHKESKTFLVTMISEMYGMSIRYTVDGTTPTLESSVYTQPIAITSTTTIKAILCKGNEVLSKTPTQRTIGMHKAIGKKIHYTLPADHGFIGSGETTLIDGFTGSSNHNDGKYQGFNNFDFDVTIDLGQKTKFSDVKASFLQSIGTWIYYPTELIVEVSNDNKKFTVVGSEKTTEDPHKIPTARKTFNIKGDFEGQYVRIIGKNAVTAEGLPGAGTVNWLFADEIFID